MLCIYTTVYFPKWMLSKKQVRDHTDMLLSLKHNPNVVIRSMSDMRVSHIIQGNCPFIPHNSIAYFSTNYTIRNARKNQLKPILLPYPE